MAPDDEPVTESGSKSSPDAFAALRVPYVGAVTLGRLLSTMGSQFVSVAVGWELYERTGDPWALGLVGLVQVAPFLVLMMPAGNLADRFPRRNVGLVGHSLLGLFSLGLAAVSTSGAPVELIYGLLMLSGAARALAAPSVTTILPQLLNPRQFANAQAWVVSSVHLAAITGPAVAGVLIAVSGAAPLSYVAAGVAQFVCVGLLTTLPVVRPLTGATRPGVRELFAGVAFIRRTPVFLGAITLDLFAVLLGGAAALLPIYAKDILQVGPAGLGLLRSSESVGAMIASLTITRLPPWRRPGRVLLIAMTGFGLATIGFGLSRNVALSLVCLAFIGVFDSVNMVIRGTLQQMITPDHLRGRVAAVNSLFVNLSNEIGAFESGAIAALLGPVIAVVSGGVGTLAVVGLVAFNFRALVGIGPLHTLRPLETAPELSPPAVNAAKI